VSKETWQMNTSNQFSHELITTTMRLGPRTIKNTFKPYNHTFNKKNFEATTLLQRIQRCANDGRENSKRTFHIWSMKVILQHVINKRIMCFESKKTCFKVYTSITNLSTNASSDWCHITGMILSSSRKRMKWASTASSARYGKAYFLSRNSLMK
jgi:hypothetical protein